jgi:pimeloyl-ACP methyl ester carboxylesterase
MIEGSAQDFKLIMDFIPAYLPKCARIYNIMGGISLGGHTAWRIASLAPDRFHGFAMVVGSPNLTSLLLTRLGIQTDLSDIDTKDYEKLFRLMNVQQRRMWPRTLDKLVRDGDRVVTESFPPDVPILLCNGKYDKLVPAKYTEEWVARRKHSKNIKLFVQDNTGHSCTKEMVALLAVWLGDMFQLHDNSARL